MSTVDETGAATADPNAGANAAEVAQLAEQNAQLRAQLAQENATLQAKIAESRAATAGMAGLTDEDVRRLENPAEFLKEVGAEAIAAVRADLDKLTAKFDSHVSSPHAVTTTTGNLGDTAL